MDKRIYLSSGYVNIPYILAFKVPFIFCVGGRGTGKTYGAFRHVLENKIKFLYMRRTQAQADIVNKPEFSPIKTPAADLGLLITSESVTKYNSAYYLGKKDTDGRILPEGLPIGYTLALSTVSNLRGFDMSDCEILIYDEFIPERHERPIKMEGSALFNAYETINRNRELSGRPALKLLSLANANDITNPIFQELDIIDKVYQMQKTGQAITINEKRGYAVVLLQDSPISQAKRQTALYRLTAGSDFESMSIDNSYNVDFDTQKINLAEFMPVFEYAGAFFYLHKSKPLYYVSTHKSGSPIELSEQLYKKSYKPVIDAYIARGQVIFETLALKEKFTF